MSWALTMASMYGPPPGWEGGKGTGWDSGTTGWEGGKGASAFEGPRRPNELLRALELCPAANSEGIRAGSDTWSHAEQTPQASDVW